MTFRRRGSWILRRAVPGAIVAALALLVYEQAGRDPAVPPGPAAAGAAVATRPDPLPKPPALSLPPIETFDAIVARPLFSETRRPAEEAAVAEAPVVPESDFVLAGTVVSESGRYLIIVPERSGKPMRLGEGGFFNGWRAVRIEPHRVVFARDDEERVVDLRFDAPRGQSAEGRPRPRAGTAVPQPRPAPSNAGPPAASAPEIAEQPPFGRDPAPDAGRGSRR